MYIFATVLFRYQWKPFFLSDCLLRSNKFFFNSDVDYFMHCLVLGGWGSIKFKYIKNSCPSHYLKY